MVAGMLAGCGRLRFDDSAPRDAASDARAGDDASIAVAFGAECAVGLAMNEPAWTGAAGEVRDSCGEHHGIAVRGATRVDDAVRGRAGELPAPSGCIAIADAPGLHATTALTMSAWIYPLALDGVNPYGVIGKRTDFENDDAEYTMFVWSDNTVWVDLDTRNDRNHGTRKLVNSQWQQLTVVFDGALPEAQRVNIYIDGALDAVLAESSASIAPRTSPLSIGCLPELPLDVSQIALAGRIDDVGVWTRAFSQAEVTAWYQATQR